MPDREPQPPPTRGIPARPPADASPIARHGSSPSELKERLEAERRGSPFLLLRDDEGRQRIHELPAQADKITVGRRPENDIALEWDAGVSRVHAEIERVGGEWTVVDDGLSRNGTFLNSERISARRRLRDGDMLRFGDTVAVFLTPGADDRPTHTRTVHDRPALPSLSETQRKVLVALARPYKGEHEFATPASNNDIAQELYLSVDAVKTHLRTLFKRFEIEHLPQNQKRAQLVRAAMQAGLISERDL